MCRVRPALIGFVGEDAAACFGSINQQILCEQNAAVRVAPGNALTMSDGCATVVEVWDPAEGTLVRPFELDAAFGQTARTVDVFGSLRGLVQRVVAGGSSAVFAYGPTGAGKTHTFYGNSSDQGLVPRAAAELLAGCSYQPILCTMLELHNDTLTDLLAPPPQRGQLPPRLEVRGGWRGSLAMVDGAREVSGTTVPKLLAAVQSGLARRQIASTMVNATSSRSHVVVTFECVASGGRLMFIDLAGCERVKRSGADGSTLREAQSINKSLQSLGDVVDALRRGMTHVPFRNSRLARLVSGALAGNGETETAVVVCVTPDAETKDEAVSALCFAERVRRIRASCVQLGLLQGQLRPRALVARQRGRCRSGRRVTCPSPLPVGRRHAGRGPVHVGRLASEGGSPCYVDAKR